MTLSPTPNMALQKPEPSVTPGPDWAQKLNDALDAIDAHDHSSGSGARVTPAGMNINADLELNSNGITEVERIDLDSQTVGAVTGTNQVFVESGNLCFNNGSGAKVQVTNGASVNNSVTNAFATSTPGAYPYTVSGSDSQRVLLVDTSAARTINLPAATTAMLFFIKDKYGAGYTNNITVHPSGANTIDGVTGDRLLNENFGTWMLISDGVSNWSIGMMIDQITPAGCIQMFGGSAAPGGWLLCQGQAISRTTYAKLYTAIGTAFGVGDGSTTFNIPDFRQKFPLGKAASGTGNALGATGGAIDHTHSIPAHYHGLGTGADLQVSSSGAHTHSIDHNHASVNSGSDGDHYHFTMYSGSGGNAPSSSTVGISSSFDGSSTAYAYDLKTGTSADKTRTSTDGAHTHTVDLPNFTGTSGSTAHAHSTSDLSGRIGLVTGGVDGNAAMTSGSQNPPFLVVNYIIKT